MDDNDKLFVHSIPHYHSLQLSDPVMSPLIIKSLAYHYLQVLEILLLPE
jgi:hypothetical protein